MENDWISLAPTTFHCIKENYNVQLRFFCFYSIYLKGPLSDNGILFPLFRANLRLSFGYFYICGLFAGYDIVFFSLLYKGKLQCLTKVKFFQCILNEWQHNLGYMSALWTIGDNRSD